MEKSRAEGARCFTASHHPSLFSDFPSSFHPFYIRTYTHTPHITPERIAQPLKDKQSCIVRGERYVKQGRSL